MVAVGAARAVGPASALSPDPSTLAPAGISTHVIFAADDGASGAELWRSDGTAGGAFVAQAASADLGGALNGVATLSNGTEILIGR